MAKESLEVVVDKTERGADGALGAVPATEASVDSECEVIDSETGVSGETGFAMGDLAPVRKSSLLPKRSR